MTSRIFYLFVLLITIACSSDKAEESDFQFNIDFEKFTLDNGLEVLMHVDRSDPVVAVALTVHVGSAREKQGKTGFAHLFEHLLFLESENLGKGGLDQLSTRVGGSGANGSTSRDRTNYYQTVPKDALEKMIWAEADKLGWFINTVTEPVLAKEKQVVKNEKRQGVDNQPYGHTSYVIDKHLYPEYHPYSLQVIGSLEDLQSATLSDVKEFFKDWYVPNNTTLVISGDFDMVQAKEWVEKYFNEIPKGEEIQALPKTSVSLKVTKKLYHEDNFAMLPELTLTWPTVEQYHPDAYALSVLTNYLSEGKGAPLYQQLVEKDKLTSSLSMYNRTSELAGQTQLRVRAYADTHLDTVFNSITQALQTFEQEGISEDDLQRIKASQETRFYNGLSSVLGKGFQLAQYNIFAKDPGFIEQDIQRTLNVSVDDVMRVYHHYVKDKNFVATSFVPRGKVEQVLSGSIKAEVVEESITQGAEESFDASVTASYEPTPSSFDRSIEPPYGETPQLEVPQVWEENLSNGLRVLGILNNEVPLVQFTIVIDGGMLLEEIDKVGVANLLAEMMTRGTKHKTAKELEESIQQLGASINVGASKESISIYGNTLAKNYPQVMQLINEIVLEPRWDEDEFELAVQEVLSKIKQQEANPNSVAQNMFNQLLYGDRHILSKNSLGTKESVQKISMDDLKHYYENFLSPTIARMHVVGALEKDKVMASLDVFERDWKPKQVRFPDLEMPEAPRNASVYFYDVPNAKQSQLRIGYLALSKNDKDFYPATVANYLLGGGGFASQLTQVLREEKGYTYGVRSNFSGSTLKGPFVISSGVRSNVTLESAQSIKNILEDYGRTFTAEDLVTTKNFLIKSNARAFETAGAKINMLENTSAYNWNYDYVKDQEKVVKEMTVEHIQELAEQYLDKTKMIWLIVGDAKTQLKRMKDLGFGEPILMNETEN
jgi:zinc protease